MAIVKTDVPMTSQLCESTIDALLEAYPYFRSENLTTTAFGRPVRTLVIGNGDRKVIFSAAHHANEWITTPLLLKFAEELAEAADNGGKIWGVDGQTVLKAVTIYLIPMVNPDVAISIKIRWYNLYTLTICGASAGLLLRLPRPCGPRNDTLF